LPPDALLPNVVPVSIALHVYCALLDIGLLAFSDCVFHQRFRKAGGFAGYELKFRVSKNSISQHDEDHDCNRNQRVDTLFVDQA